MIKVNKEFEAVGKAAYLLYIRIPKDKLQHISYKLVTEKA